MGHDDSDNNKSHFQNQQETPITVVSIMLNHTGKKWANWSWKVGNPDQKIGVWQSNLGVGRQNEDEPNCAGSDDR